MSPRFQSSTHVFDKLNDFAIAAYAWLTGPGVSISNIGFLLAFECSSDMTKYSIAILWHPVHNFLILVFFLCTQFLPPAFHEIRAPRCERHVRPLVLLSFLLAIFRWRRQAQRPSPRYSVDSSTSSLPTLTFCPASALGTPSASAFVAIRQRKPSPRPLLLRLDSTLLVPLCSWPCPSLPTALIKSCVTELALGLDEILACKKALLDPHAQHEHPSFPFNLHDLSRGLDLRHSLQLVVDIATIRLDTPSVVTTKNCCSPR